jgi:DNA-binding transcriptional MocR family regulator
MRGLLSALEERLPEPTARGLVASVTAAIREGVLVPGDRMPPIRTVATQLGLSPTTVNAAWSLLARSGAIHTDGRRGTTVTDLRSAGARRYRHAVQPQAEFEIDLSTGVPDQALLPDLKRALQELKATAATPGSYLDEPVLPELVEVFAADWPYPAERFMVTDGAMDAIELIARTTLGFGDRVVVEHPVFPPLLDLLDSLGAQIVGIPLDAQGPVPAALREALTTASAAVVLQPRAQNPTGISMNAERAEQLAEILAGRETLVIEDDSAGAIATAPALSLGRWLPERTLHVRSYSKSHGPDLRLASLSGPAGLVDRITARRQLGQGWGGPVLQRIPLRPPPHDRARGQVSAARAEYARRRHAALERLAPRGIAPVGDDGLNLWLPVADEAAALVRLASQGIGVAPGTPFAVLPDQPAHLRVTIGLVSAGKTSLVDQLGEAATVTGGWGRAR